jgi:hypothetical protein
MLIMSIKIEQLKCHNCGAPFEHVVSAILRCQHCQTEFVQSQLPSFQILTALPNRPVGRVPQASIQLAGITYGIHGLLGRGLHKEAWLVRRQGAFAQLAVLKRRISGTALAREWEALEELTGSPTGAYLERLLPVPLALDLPRGLALYSFLPGFTQSPQSFGELAPVHLVWMANRLLEQLNDLHLCGLRHGQLDNRHWLVCARDHGVALCSWSSLQRGPGSLDLAQLAKELLKLAPAKTPKPLVQAFASFGDGRAAGQIRQDLKALALALLGPPRFVPLQVQ